MEQVVPVFSTPTEANPVVPFLPGDCDDFILELNWLTNSMICLEHGPDSVQQIEVSEPPGTVVIREADPTAKRTIIRNNSPTAAALVFESGICIAVIGAQQTFELSERGVMELTGATQSGGNYFTTTTFRRNLCGDPPSEQPYQSEPVGGFLL